jgi:hypothetical protein
MILRESRRTGGTLQGRNKKPQHPLHPSRPSLCPLSNDPFTHPYSASCATLSRGTQGRVWAPCRFTHCQNKNEGRATFSPKKEGKKGSSAFPARTKLTNQKSNHSNYVIVFLLFYVYLFFYRCHLTTDNIYNR